MSENFCTVDCSDYTSRATALESQAREAHFYADVSPHPEDRQYARDLKTEAESLWDHMNRYHPQVMDDLRSY